MNHLNQAISVNIALGFSILMIAAAANASMLDCSKSPGLELVSGAECSVVAVVVAERKLTTENSGISAPSTKTAAAGFQVNQTRTTSAVPESAPLLMLVGALLAVVLVRAKSYNTK